MKAFFVVLIGFVSASVQAQDPVTLYWQDLIPGNEAGLLEKLPQAATQSPDASQARPAFDVVTELDGQKVKLPGFIVPLEFSEDGKLEDFLLVPYHGACIHMPAPPPNQVVYAKTEQPQQFPGLWTPVWLIGTLSTDSFLNTLGDAGYTLQIDRWDLYKGRE